MLLLPNESILSFDKSVNMFNISTEYVFQEIVSVEILYFPTLPQSLQFIQCSIRLYFLSQNPLMNFLRKNPKYSLNIFCLNRFIILNIFKLWVYSIFLIKLLGSYLVLHIKHKRYHSCLLLSDFFPKDKIIIINLRLLNHLHLLFYCL